MEEEQHKRLQQPKHKKLLPCFEESNSSPWLIYTHSSSKYKQVHTFYNISSTPNTTSPLKTISQLNNKSIISSINGCWLILRDVLQLDMFSIFNPFTLHTVDLPPLQAPNNEGGNIKCGLKSTPDCYDCLLLLCFTKANIMFSCNPARPDCSWITHHFQLQGSDSSVSNIFTVKGVMYVSNSDVFSDNFLYRVDVSSSLILRPLQIRLPFFVGIDYLVESYNHIYFVELVTYSDENFKLEYVTVYELDFNGCCWREIKSLNGRSFFLGVDNCTWCWGTTNESGSQTGIQRDCIYFQVPSAEPEPLYAEPLYVYNLHDDSLLPLRPSPSLTNICNKKLPIWAIPQHLMLSSLGRLYEEIREVNINELRQNFELTKQKLVKENKFSELPPDMIEKISKHLHLFDYWNFRATSKIYQSLCPAPLWRTNNVLPLFLFFNNDESCKLIDPCHNGLLYHAPFFRKPFNILFSKNGWVLVKANELQYFNIFTGKGGNYPYFYDLYKIDSIAFSTYPTCTNCLTIGIGHSLEDSLNIYYIETEKGTWNKCVFEYEDEYDCFDTSKICPIFLAGAFYMMDKQGRLGVFQLVNGEASWRMYAKPQTLSNFYAPYLVEKEGELYSVFIEKMGKWVQVFRFDKLMKHWFQVQYLENHIFFISRASSFSIVTRDCKMKNRIYFSRLYKKGVVFYSQDTRKYHSSVSDDVIENFYGTSEPLRCCWI